MRLHIGSKTRSSWSMRPWVMLKMANISFTEIEHQYLADLTEQRQQWSQFSPTSKVPVLEDNGLVIWDSLAICQYLAEQYPTLYPATKEARAWVYSAVAEMHSGFTELREQCNYTLFPAEQIQPNAALIAELQRIDTLWLEGLSRFQGKFLAGNTFTVADAFYAPVVIRLKNYALVNYFSPAVQAYIERIWQLEPVQDWCQG